MYQGTTQTLRTELMFIRDICQPTFFYSSHDSRTTKRNRRLFERMWVQRIIFLLLFSLYKFFQEPVPPHRADDDGHRCPSYFLHFPWLRFYRESASLSTIVLHYTCDIKVRPEECLQGDARCGETRWCIVKLAALRFRTIFLPNPFLLLDEHLHERSNV